MEKVEVEIVHEPKLGDWTVVSQDTNMVTVLAMCTCGDNNCAFVASVFRNEFVHINPGQVVRRG